MCWPVSGVAPKYGFVYSSLFCRRSAVFKELSAQKCWTSRSSSPPAGQGRSVPTCKLASSARVKNPDEFFLKSNFDRRREEPLAESADGDKPGDSETREDISAEATKALSSAAEPLGSEAPSETVESGLHFKRHDDLVEALENLKGDPLEKDGGRIVIYRGHPMAQIVIVGEGPGEEEDKRRLPFVGRSGELLNEIFEAARFEMDEHVYITNAVKRRPLNNRTPTVGEIKYYRPWLMEEIRLVDPAIIVVTGSTSLRAVLGEKLGITKVRGQWRHWNGMDVMPTFHPSYVLRYKEKKREIWSDVLRIRQRFDELFPDIHLGPVKTGKDKRTRDGW